MARSKRQSKSKNLFIVGISILSLLAISALIGTVTYFGILNPHASALTLKVNKSVLDPFKDGSTVDSALWSIAKAGDVANISVTQSITNNLRIELPNKSSSAALVLNQSKPIEALGDFSMDITLYKPTVNGAGAARAGIQFMSTGTDNDEVAGVFWQAQSGKTGHSLVFYVNGGHGLRRVTTVLPLGNAAVPNAIILRLIRSDKSYAAYVKVASVNSDDIAWQLVGQCTDAKIGNERVACNNLLGKGGNLRIFADNRGIASQNPQSVVQIDTAHVRWQDSTYTSTTPDAVSFVDNFGDNVIGAKWNTAKSVPSITFAETKANNLVVNIPNTASLRKVGSARVTRITPEVGPEKDFTYTAALYKPIVTGDGSGIVTMAFVPSRTGQTEPKESASISWIVSKTSSNIVFNVRDRTGKPLPKASKPVTFAANTRVTLRLTRVTTDSGTKYRAYFHTGDSDTDWTTIGDAESELLGENGKFVLMVSNLGVMTPVDSVHYPEVKARFDQVSAVIEK